MSYGQTSQNMRAANNSYEKERLNMSMLRRLNQYLGEGEDQGSSVNNRPVANFTGMGAVSPSQTIQSKPSTSSGIMQGMSSVLDMLNSGTGQKLSALAFKDPYVRAEMIGKGEKTQDQELNQKNLTRQAYAQKMGIGADYLGQQTQLETQERLAGVKAKQDADTKAEEAKADAIKTTLTQQKDKITQDNIDYDDYLKQHAAGQSSAFGVKLGKDPLSKPDFIKFRDEAAKRGL
jgi:hypothetical protein